jgi:multiple antibiotic resistance protein
VPIPLVDIAIAFFIGMGPIKIVVAYLAATHGAGQAIRRRVAFTVVGAAATTALALVFGGALLLKIFHVNGAALVIAGGLVMVVFGLQTVLSGTEHLEELEAPTDEALMREAIYPLAVPILLNPAGIAAAMILSVELVESGGYVAAGLVVLGMALLDLVVLLVAGATGHRVPYAAITILEKVFGTLLVAIGVQLVLIGADRLSIIQMVVPSP